MLDLIAYAGALVLLRLLAALPLGAALALGRGLGSLCYYAIPLRRAVVLGNLRHVFGATRSEREIRAIARDAYREFAMALVEFLRCAVADARRFVVHTDVQGIDRLLAAQKAKTPLVICFAHAGSIDLAGYTVGILGVRLHAIMKPLRSPRFNRLLVGARERHGVRVLTKGAEAFQELFELLDEGAIVALLPDQNARRHGVTVDFLGKPASTFKGPAILHLVTGAALVVGVDERLASDPRKHVVRLKFLEPYEPTGDRETDIRAVTQRMSDAMSEAILRNPAQYFWFHRRWGKALFAPAGAASR